MAVGDDWFALLRAATVLLDPFPFGGGVTTLEAFAMCRAVVTAPRLQSVPALARGMRARGADDLPSFFVCADRARPGAVPLRQRYRHMNMTARDAPIARDAQELAKLATALADDPGRRSAIKGRICAARDDAAAPSLFATQASVEEWAAFLTRAATPHL